MFIDPTRKESYETIFLLPGGRACSNGRTHNERAGRHYIEHHGAGQPIGPAETIPTTIHVPA